jgi:hypothetical protein
VRRLALAVLLGAAAVSPLGAQVPDSLTAAGIRAYRNLDFDAAGGYLRRALTLLGPGLDTARVLRALTYLGATELFRGRPDSARAAFRRLVRLDPRYRIDQLIFPPEVTTVFDAVRRTTPAVLLRMPSSLRFRAGDDGLTATMFASAFHEVRAELQQPDASTVRRLYLGPVADSLAFTWDGHGTDGRPIPSGPYHLAIVSYNAAGDVARVLRVPLQIRLVPADTLPEPAPPTTELLPEREAGAAGVESLLGGLLIGTAVALVPSAAASDVPLGAGRYAIGGAIALGGVLGFLTGAGERSIPENVAVNDRIRAAWRARRDTVAAENARRREAPEVTIRAGTPQAIEREQS